MQNHMTHETVTVQERVAGEMPNEFWSQLRRAEGGEHAWVPVQSCTRATSACPLAELRGTLDESPAKTLEIGQECTFRFATSNNAIAHLDTLTKPSRR